MLIFERAQNKTGDGIAMKKLTLCVIVAIFCGIIAAQNTFFRDVVYLSAGEEVRCEVLTIDDKTVTVRTTSGMRTFRTDEILRITFTQKRLGDTWKTVEDINDSTLLAAIDVAQSIAETTFSSQVILHESVNYELAQDSTLTKTVRVISLILTEAAKGENATLSFEFVSPKMNGDIMFCRTVTADGKIFHLDDAAYEFSQPTMNFVDYNFLRRIKFAPPQLNCGCVLDYCYRIKYSKLAFDYPILETVYFGASLPTIEKIIVAKYPKTLEKLVRHMQTKSVPAVESLVNGENVTVRWQMFSPQLFVTEALAAPKETFMPTLWLCFDYDTRDVRNQLGAFFINSYSASDIPTRAMDSTTSTLTAQCATSGEKLEKILAFFHKTIRKAPAGIFETGFRLVPISQVFDRGTAGELDGAHLLCSLLKLCDINARMVLVPDFWNNVAANELHTFAVFQNVLVAATIDNKTVYIDPLDEFAPASYFPPQFFGQKPFIWSSDTVYAAKLPAVADKFFERAETITVTIDKKGDAKIVKTNVAGSYSAAPLRSSFRQGSDKMRMSLEQNTFARCNECELASFEFTGIEDVASTVVLKQVFNAKSLIDSKAKNFAFELPFAKTENTIFATEKRASPMFFAEPQFLTRVWKIVLPAGLKVHFLPNNYSARLDSALFSLEYKTLSSDTIMVYEQWRFSKKLVSASDYIDYKSFFEKRTQKLGEPLILRKK